MTPLPKRKLSSGRRDRRRAHDALTPHNLVECPQCHERKMSHRICPNCGYYKGREVISHKEE